MSLINIEGALKASAFLQQGADLDFRLVDEHSVDRSTEFVLRTLNIRDHLRRVIHIHEGGEVLFQDFSEQQTINAIQDWGTLIDMRESLGYLTDAAMFNDLRLFLES